MERYRNDAGKRWQRGTTRDDAAYGYRELGRLLYKERELSGARVELTKAVNLRTPLRESHPDNADDSSRLALAIYSKMERDGALPVPEGGNVKRTREGLEKLGAAAR